jgi:uncharacterized cupin superfamily protein
VKSWLRPLDSKRSMIAGDAFFFGPSDAHQLTNTGDEDFAYYVIGDNPRGESCYYPDSGKWTVPLKGADEAIVREKRPTVTMAKSNRVVRRSKS